MSKQFICIKPGGVKRGDLQKGTGEDEELILIEGTKEKGPWYDLADFQDRLRLINTCIEKGWILVLDENQGD